MSQNANESTPNLNPKYPYTAYLVDNSGSLVYFWLSGPNKGHIMNSDPLISVTIDEKRLTPSVFKCQRAAR